MNAFYIDNMIATVDSGGRQQNSGKRLAITSLIGDTIFNTSGDNLGKIKDVIVDLSKSSIEYIVIEFGGFLGMNQKYLAVPPDALIIAKEHKNAFILNETRESLKGYPTFDLDQLPETGREHLADAALTKNIW
jgi:sporulation protein YlmC with PRC-barrel domain